MNSEKNKILIISYHFAPSGSTGGIRALKFVKYLPDYSIEPIIVLLDPVVKSYPASLPIPIFLLPEVL